MTNKKMTRAEIIRWLGEAISTETEKPFEEIDYDFVDECGRLLDELMGKSAALSEIEIADRVANLNHKTCPVNRKDVRIRNIHKIFVAAAIIMCLSITIFAIPVIRTMILTALELNVGESVEIDGITCIYNGVEKTYTNIDEVIESEGLDFLPPRIQSEELKLEKIVSVGESNTVLLCFDDKSINYEIWLGNTDISSYSSNATKYHYGKYTTYIITSDDFNKTTYYSYTIVDDDIHNIVSTNIENIELLISSID